jgi:Mg-chelatase subunit ChlD
VVILLTDGLQNVERAPNSAVLGEAQRLKDRGALVYTIGLGNEIDQALLEQVASSADRFYRSPTTDDLARIYTQISERITCDLRAPEP